MSTITQNQVAAAMDEWLTTVGLTVSEAVAIRTLKIAADKSIAEFRNCAIGLFKMMPTVIRPAITKARQQGKCQEWPDV